MSRRAGAIVMLVLLVLQVILGGGRGISTVCLGGGHTHDSAASSPAEAACGRVCHHEPFRPVPEPLESHEDGCDCHDVRLGVVDVSITCRDSDVAEHIGMVSPIPAMLCEWGQLTGEVAGSPRPPRMSASGAQRAAVIRCTRLLI